MSYDVTNRFFHWMEANNITRKEASEALGVDERSLSTYRSRGLPRKKQARAEQLMLAHHTASQPISTDENKVNVVFSDEDFKLVLDAAEIVGAQLPEFIRKAATFKAQEEIANHRGLRVADDETPYANPKQIEEHQHLKIAHNHPPDQNFV